MGLGQRAPLVLEAPRRLEGGSSLAEQDRIAGEAKDKIRPTVGGDHVDARGCGQWGRRYDSRRTKIMAFSAPVGRMPNSVRYSNFLS